MWELLRNKLEIVDLGVTTQALEQLFVRFVHVVVVRKAIQTVQTERGREAAFFQPNQLAASLVAHGAHFQRGRL